MPCVERLERRLTDTRAQVRHENPVLIWWEIRFEGVAREKVHALANVTLLGSEFPAHSNHVFEVEDSQLQLRVAAMVVTMCCCCCLSDSCCCGYAETVCAQGSGDGCDCASAQRRKIVDFHGDS